MTVEQGMDVERIRSIAQQLMSQGDKITAVASTGRAQMRVLDGAWEGADLQDFGGRWETAETTAQGAGESVRRFGELMALQADQQQDASDGVGGASGSGGTGPGRGDGEGPGSGGSDDDGFDLGDLTALGPLGGGIAALVTKGPRLFAALTGDVFKMYQGLMPEGRLAAMLGASGSQMDDLFRATIPAKISGRLGGLLRTVGPTMGKVLGPLGVLTGAYDVYAGIRDGDYLRAAGGGLGALSGGLATAAAFGVALGPVGIGVMAVAGIAAAGIAIYQNWDAITGAVSDIGGAIADGASAVGGAIADGAGEVADAVGSVISDPVGAIGGLFG